MPHEVSKMSPELIQGCDLLEGDLGGVGSIIYWKYTHGMYFILHNSVHYYVQE
ncbi:hypothetical protein F511_46249 [Dorcoceras hygrometricum]|uniref:Bet v I/Major latex protein domain-containing protein n=1 Tax=Dorcoceras hygrometricum TaxID=472368 RepID=A0A2Z6ZU10_9LAMI|nr:hypothetical protein F511_46249 [Dorcoceras hygrometricum]